MSDHLLLKAAAIFDTGTHGNATIWLRFDITEAAKASLNALYEVAVGALLKSINNLEDRIVHRYCAFAI